MNRVPDGLINYLSLMRLSLIVQFGHRYWLVPVLVLIWPLLHAALLTVGWIESDYKPESAQNLILGIPLYCLAVGIGIRIIANEIELRTIEVAYTIPKGASRVWITKLIVCLCLLISAECLLVFVVNAFLVSLSFSAIFVAFQSAVFLLVLSMWLGALVKNEMAAILLSLVAVYLCLINDDSRWSPMFNRLKVIEKSDAQLLEWSVQNSLWVAILIFTLCILAFRRASQSESLL